jgi:hypothetical protein
VRLLQSGAAFVYYYFRYISNLKKYPTLWWVRRQHLVVMFFLFRSLLY